MNVESKKMRKQQPGKFHDLFLFFNNQPISEE
jgi:hypothetical protein